MAAPELTQGVIEDGMALSEKVACRPGHGRSYALPDSLEDVRQTCTPKGRRKIV